MSFGDAVFLHATRKTAFFMATQRRLQASNTLIGAELPVFPSPDSPQPLPHFWQVFSQREKGPLSFQKSAYQVEKGEG
jgi:hypothetical protein